jgi:glycosyltransferase involved in cell wall biosynthesis
MKPVAYMLQMFPTLTETFIFGEITELRRRGLPLELFALSPLKEGWTCQPDAQQMAGEVTYAAPLLSGAVLGANLRWLSRRPGRYFGTLGRLVAAAWRNPVHLAKSLYVFFKAAELADHMTRRGIGHIHAHWATYPTTAALSVSGLTGIPFSFTAHAWDVDLIQTLLPEKLRLARFAVTCTAESQGKLQSMVPPESRRKVLLNYHGVMADKIAAVPRGVPADPPLIVTCGSLLRRKGFAELIQACGILKRAGRRFQCLIIGAGRQRTRNELTLLIQREGVSGEVTLAGPLSQADVFSHYARSDIFTLPCKNAILSLRDPEAGFLKGLEAWFENNAGTVKDGIPNVLVEAMVMGLPVVSTAFSGIPELVEHGRNGLLVQPGDAAELANALDELLSDPTLRKRLGEQAAVDARARFDRRTNTGLLAEIFVAQLTATAGDPDEPRRGSSSTARAGATS